MKGFPDDPVPTKGDLGPLFEAPVALARTTDPATSHAAAAKTEADGVASRHRRMIVDLLAARRDGYTADELDAHFGFEAHTAGKRLSELVRVEPTPDIIVTVRTRPTRRGGNARVYLHTRWLPDWGTE